MSMSENKSLIRWVSCIIGVSVLLVISVWASDRFAIIDHSLHFHLDKDKIEKEIETQIHEERLTKESEKNAESWAKEVEAFWIGRME